MSIFPGLCVQLRLTKSDLHQVILVISDRVRSRETEFQFLWRMFDSHTISHTHVAVCDEERSLCSAILCPSALHANECCSLLLMLMSLFLSSSREWLIRFPLCWETSLDSASSVWYLEKRRICVGVGVQKPIRIF